MLKEGQLKGKTSALWRGKRCAADRGGRRHFEKQVDRLHQEIMARHGFSEMSGNLYRQAFWTWMRCSTSGPPGRAMQDTFYIMDPPNGQFQQNLPSASKKYMRMEAIQAAKAGRKCQQMKQRETCYGRTQRTFCTNNRRTKRQQPTCQNSSHRQSVQMQQPDWTIYSNSCIEAS